MATKSLNDEDPSIKNIIFAPKTNKIVYGTGNKPYKGCLG